MVHTSLRFPGFHFQEMHIFWKNHSALLSKGRPPNRICKWCYRKRLAPEKGLNGWRFPPKKVCKSCTSLEFNDFKNVSTNKKRLIKSDKEAADALPLLMLDDDKEEAYLQTSLKSIRTDLKKYDNGYRKSNIRIVDRQHQSVKDYFLDRSGELR
jgi:hypothetical protein